MPTVEAITNKVFYGFGSSDSEKPEVHCDIQIYGFGDLLEVLLDSIFKSVLPLEPKHTFCTATELETQSQEVTKG